MSSSAIALLGRQDHPTDAVEDYCRFLADALRVRGVDVKLERVPWAERGWQVALSELPVRAANWRGKWVLIQYTALAWSARGFPLRLIRVIKKLRDAGVRIAVVFHDGEPYSGARMVDEMRRRIQLHTMQRALHYAEVAVFTVALSTISWMGNPPSKAVLIPVGANLPAAALRSRSSVQREDRPLSVAIFGITGGAAGDTEVAQIVAAMRFAAAKVGRLRLHAFGRNANAFESRLREALRGAAVDVQVEGMLPPEQIIEVLYDADALLFVRGAISSRRGSAIAGIACGLPVIAYSGRETAAPVTEAGVVLVPEGNDAELGEALARVLADREYRATLGERSRTAHAQFFSWDAIAMRYLDTLSK
jgi:glycosyltransferase involved in cell wall biosynthesis